MPLNARDCQVVFVFRMLSAENFENKIKNGRVKPMLVHPLSCWCQDLMCQEDSAQHTDMVPADTAPATLLSSVGPYPASGGNSAVCCLCVSFEMANEPEMDLKI